MVFLILGLWLVFDYYGSERPCRSDASKCGMFSNFDALVMALVYATAFVNVVFAILLKTGVVEKTVLVHKSKGFKWMVVLSVLVSLFFISKPLHQDFLTRSDRWFGTDGYLYVRNEKIFVNFDISNLDKALIKDNKSKDHQNKHSGFGLSDSYQVVFVALAEDENGVFVAEGIYFNENSLPFGKPFVRGKGFTKENNAKVTVDYGFYKHPNVQKGKVL